MDESGGDKEWTRMAGEMWLGVAGHPERTTMAGPPIIRGHAAHLAAESKWAKMALDPKWAEMAAVTGAVANSAVVADSGVAVDGFHSMELARVTINIDNSLALSEQDWLHSRGSGWNGGAGRGG